MQIVQELSLFLKQVTTHNEENIIILRLSLSYFWSSFYLIWHVIFMMRGSGFR